MKKNLIQNKKRCHIVTREWLPGDYVKIREYDITGLPSYSYGIILRTGNDEQMRIFPCFDIYVPCRGTIDSVGIYNLEIVSAVA